MKTTRRFKTTLAIALFLMSARPARAIDGRWFFTSTDTGAGLQGATVYLLEAVSAAIHGIMRTDARGAYQSGLLSPGHYKVRFAGIVLAGNFYPAAYYNARGEDLWELAGIVEVTDRTNTVVNIAQKSAIPSPIVECRAIVSGVVTTASGTPLGGIQVSARNTLNAMPIEIAGVQVTATTDSSGNYELRMGGVCVSDKIRFVDPSGNYLSEYSGAGGADDFSLGAALARAGFDERPRELNESLARVTPDQAIQNVIDLVGDLGLSTDSNLIGGLERGVAIVLDANPNNDTATCGILDAFIKQVNGQLARGQLTRSQANALIQSALTAKTAIACP